MRKEYERLTEMAWQAVTNFIHPLDCSNRWGDSVLPMNKNDTLEVIYNGGRDINGDEIRPYYFSKSRMEMHLNQADTYYYRSRPFAPAKTGYGGYEAAHEKFDFAQKLGLNSKSQKFEDVCVMLLGIDIDAKHGENDAGDVCRMLLELYPGSYHEPSTGGSGIHLYLKVFYPSDLCQSRRRIIERIHHCCVDLSSLLERLRIEQGFASCVDKVRGYPTLLGWDDSSGRVVVQNRSICIKVPRFIGGEKDVVWFQGSPFVDFRYLEQLVLDRKRQDLLNAEETDEDEEKPLSRAYTSNFEDIDEQDHEHPGEGVCVCSNSVCPERYSEVIERLSKETDAHRRCVDFSLAYARHLKRIPSLQDLLDEYEHQGLNSGVDHDLNRRRRLEVMHSYIKRTFNTDKLGFDLGGFVEEQGFWLDLITQRLTEDTDLSYKQGTIRPIKLVEIAALYFALCRSQSGGSQTSFSIEQVRHALLGILGSKGSRHKAVRLIAILQEIGLIEQVAGAVPGYRGKVWEVLIPEQKPSLYSPGSESTKDASYEASQTTSSFPTTL